MHKISLALFLFFSISCQLDAQIWPKEDSKLCYRIIGFIFPVEEKAIDYQIEIATGNYNTETSFEKNILTSIHSKENKNIIEVTSFGCQYTWRVVCTENNNVKVKGTFYHFSTKVFPNVDTTVMRLRIIKEAQKYADAYVFIDGVKVLYDMKGSPVWFLPGADLLKYQTFDTRDTKLTPQGTITFLTGLQPYEIDYNGNILWRYKTPENQSADIFHHEFTRLKNGRYMGMVSKTTYVPVPAFKDKVARNAVDSARYYYKANYTDLMEYDANNQVVWRWSDLDYIKKNNLFFLKDINGRYINLLRNILYDGRYVDLDLHENSFYFDEKKKNIYLSLRNTNEIIKIKYPSGNIVNVYGPEYDHDTMKMKNEMFSYQHSCKLSEKGYLYMFNNNAFGASHIPTVVMMQESASGKGGLKKIWEYQCTVEDDETAVSKNLSFVAGGNVMELPDQSIFVSMCKPYSKIFIVNLDKNILWSAMPEQYNIQRKKWEQINLYRASIIPGRKELEQMIWNSEK